MVHSYSFKFCPVSDKNRAKGKLCVCSVVCYVSLNLLLMSPNYFITICKCKQGSLSLFSYQMLVSILTMDERSSSYKVYGLKPKIVHSPGYNLFFDIITYLARHLLYQVMSLLMPATYQDRFFFLMGYCFEVCRLYSFILPWISVPIWFTVDFVITFCIPYTTHILT